MKKWLKDPHLFAHIDESYRVAIVLSVLLHLVMLVVLSVGWNSNSVFKRPPPIPISAALVTLPAPSVESMELQRADEAQKQAEAARQAEARKRAETRKHDELRKQAEAKKRAEQKRQRALALKQEEERQQQLLREQEEARRQLQEQARLQKEQQERMRLEQEQQRREQEALEQVTAFEQQAIKDAQLASDQLEQAKYAGIIKSLTSQYWNRPPSARNNMMAEIRISLSPVGDVLSVAMVKSSGSDEFDRSIIQAIRRAAPFSELKNLERRIFNQYFRRITFRFRPEDLVR